MKKYLATDYEGYSRIEEVDIDRETESSVFLGKTRFRKETQINLYASTWRQARGWLKAKGIDRGKAHVKD